MRAPRFVALGDSLTEGVGDPAGNGWRGWAALRAGALAEADVELTNLAVSGAQTREVLEVRTPVGLAGCVKRSAVGLRGCVGAGRAVPRAPFTASVPPCAYEADRGAR
jgi:hypothetical protein